MRGRRGRSTAIDLDGAGDGRSSTTRPCWPCGRKQLAGSARQWVARSLLDGRLAGATYAVHIPEGGLRHDRPMSNDWINVVFDVAGRAGADRLRPAGDRAGQRAGRAAGRPAGRRGRLGPGQRRRRSARASVEIDRLKGTVRTLTTRFRATGEARRMLQVVDAPGNHVLTHGGFAPRARSAAQADATIEMSRPLGVHGEPTFDQYDIRYRAWCGRPACPTPCSALTLHSPAAAFDGHRRGPERQGTGPDRALSRVGRLRAGLRHRRACRLARPWSKACSTQVAVGAGRPGAFAGRFQTRGGQGLRDDPQRGLQRRHRLASGAGWPQRAQGRAQRRRPARPGPAGEQGHGGAHARAAVDGAKRRRLERLARRRPLFRRHHLRLRPVRRGALLSPS